MNGKQVVVLLVSILFILIVIEKFQMHEKIIVYSQMIEMLEQFINDPEEVRSAQHEHDIKANIKRMWKDSNLRFTLIRGDGVVLIDGAINHLDMPNQLEQPEIQEALVTGRGYAIRESKVTDGKMMYVAKPITTPWGTLYARLGTEPDYIHEDRNLWVLPVIMFVGGYFLVKFCERN